MNPPMPTDDQLSWKDLQAHALWWARLGYAIFSFFWQVLWKYWKLSFGLMLLFALLQIGRLYGEAQEYEMTSTFVYGDLHPKVFGDMIAKINSLMANQETEQVSQLLALKSSQVDKIKSIRVADSRGKSLVDNYTMTKEPMIITVKMGAPIPGDSLQTAINTYLNSNPFSAKRLDMKKRLLSEELSFINNKQATIDSVLKRLYEVPQTQATNPDLGAINIENSEGKNAYDLLRFSRELVQRKSDIENSLVQVENVFAIDNFIVLPSAQFSLGAIIKKGIIGGIMGFLLTAVLLLWRLHLGPWIRNLDES